ncbi:MAG: class I SAM-dependent methyltransferase [Polaromonas sp.]|nr:class I SAM-dependent methyltransferase [Polaromonas sp.]
MFAHSDDPWGFRNRWYEARKRDLTLACLPAARYRHAYEPGCANGELAAALATRCDRLLASDGSAPALAIARDRLQSMPNVELRQAWLPDDWPAGLPGSSAGEGRPGFDLVVFSELGFYLDTAQLSVLIARMKASLASGGTVLACHWRHPVEGHALDGDAVHAALAAQLDMPRLLRHEEADFLLEVWSHDARSVAQVEGFV